MCLSDVEAVVGCSRVFEEMCLNMSVTWKLVCVSEDVAQSLV